MLTVSGVSICRGQIALPSPSDLAIQMSRITRYGGAIWCPLLFHSLLVGKMLPEDTGEQTVLYGLLHDAHETVLGEIPHNWKPKGRDDDERAIDDLILSSAGLDRAFIDFQLVKHCDRAAVHVETRKLGPLTNWEGYAQHWDKGFDPGDLTRPNEIADKLIWHGFANAAPVTDVYSWPVSCAGVIFSAVFDKDHSRAIKLLNEL